MQTGGPTEKCAKDADRNIQRKIGNELHARRGDHLPGQIVDDLTANRFECTQARAGKVGLDDRPVDCVLGRIHAIGYCARWRETSLLNVV